MFCALKYLKQNFLAILALSVLCLGFSNAGFSQTLMPLPNHSSVYSGSARGYWFIAPTNFTITGLRVPSQAGTGPQYIQVVKLGVTPPISFTSQTSNFTTLIYINGAQNGVIQSVNIPISAGDVIGILGTAGTGNSYANGAYTTNIYGNNFTIQRFGYQGHITGGATSQVWGVAQGDGGSISRVELYYGQPCAGVTNMAVSNISSMAADFNWTGVTGSNGYDYAVDQTAALSPTGTVVNINTTNGNITGLTPATTYYLHVRNYCSSTDKSAWDTVSFETLPPCSEAQGVTITNVDSNSASFTWNALVTALNYRYVVDTIRSDPAYNAGLLTNNAAGSVVNLLEGTKYYLHIKAYCQANDSSGWSLDSFYTPIVCRAPQVLFNDINTNRAVAYWSSVRSALKYEYYTSTESTPPAVGTETHNSSTYIPYLDADQKYYFHIRSHCSDRGILSISKWATYEFSTHAVSVGEVEGADMVAIYPNPATDNFTFYVDGAVDDGTLTISDISGKKVKDVVINKEQTEVSMKGLQPGMYILKYSTSKSTGTYRLLKQ